jgi:hypothetical protein
MTHGLLAVVLHTGLVASALSPQNEDWDGISYLHTTAVEANVNLSIPKIFNWNELADGTVLLMVDGADRSTADNLLLFIEQGGEAVLTVDVDHSASHVLEAFGLTSSHEPLDHDRYYEDHPAFPLLVPPNDAVDSFLWFNVQEIVGNHSLVLRPDPRSPLIHNPLVRYKNANDWFAVEVEYGRGRVVVVADSNDMQRHLYGDKQFVANLYRFFCQSTGSCDVTVLLPTTECIGTWNPRVPDGIAGLKYIFLRGVHAIEKGWVELGREMSHAGMIRMLGWGLLVCILLALVRLPKSGPLVGFGWSRLSPAVDSMERFWLQALSRGRKEASFARPALALLMDFESCVAEFLPEIRSSQLDQETMASYSERLAAISGHPIEGISLQCLIALNRVRDVASAERLPHFDLREFEDLWTNCSMVRKALHPKLS